MSMWIRNLKTRLEDHPVVLLHGNVRDRYIDEHSRVYDNLTTLLMHIAHELPMPFSELMLYDAVGHERRMTTTGTQRAPQQATSEDTEFAGTEPASQLGQRRRPTQVLAQWSEQLRVAEQNSFAVLFYLDKLVAYKTTYQEDEKEILLRLEKVIENITPNHRLILVALQDTMIPVELYTNAPKTVVLPIAAPDKADRMAYLKRRLDGQYLHLDLIADLTDGLFLRDLDNIVATIASDMSLSSREVHRVVNKYRIGEQEDYWGTLSIDKLDDAPRWFVEDKGIKGQNEAIGKVIDTLCLARTGLSGLASGTDTKPKGVLYFAGPTGVGKTFMAKKLAEFLFGTEEAFLRFDMSEFKEEHTVSKLIGSPPGYVGYERGGMLTNAVREHPFSVILFDEVEKAHPKIMDIFLQILEDGRLTDSRGQTVFFTETVIIYTSNLGTRTMDSRNLPVDERQALDAIVEDNSRSDEDKKTAVREHFIRAVERFFMVELSRPELLNRIGNNIVPFNYIHAPEIQMAIVHSHLQRIKDEFEDKQRAYGHHLVFDDRVILWLVQQYSKRISLFGARGITFAINDEIMVPLARRVLVAEHYGHQGITFHVDAPDGQGITVVAE